MKKIITSASIFCIIFFSSFSGVDAFKLYGDYTNKTLISIEKYPTIKNKIDSLFTKLENKIESYSVEQKTKVYDRIQSNVLKYKKQYSRNANQEIHAILDYMYESAGIKLYLVKSPDSQQDIVTQILGDVVNQPTTPVDTNTQNNNKIPYTLSAIENKTYTVTDGNSLLLGEFKVNGVQNEIGLGTKLTIKLKSKKYGYDSTSHGYSGVMDLFRDGKRIKSIPAQEQTSVSFEHIDLQPGIYSIKASVYGITDSDTLSAHMQSSVDPEFSDEQRSLKLNSFIGKKQSEQSDTDIDTTPQNNEVYPSIQFQSISANTRGKSEIGMFKVIHEDMDIEKMVLQLYTGDSRTFQIKNEKVYIVQKTGLKTVASNTTFQKAKNGNILVSFKNIELKKDTQYLLWVEDITVEDDIFLSTRIKEINSDNETTNRLLKNKKISDVSIDD